MAHFIETLDKDGKAVLVNLDRITTIEPVSGRLHRFRGPDCDTELEIGEPFQLKDDSAGRINMSLLKIWDILRARLH